jgi:hypothetical protein
MSFGLRNAAQTFQRFMDEILNDMDFCFAFSSAVLRMNATNISVPSFPNSKPMGSSSTDPNEFFAPQ